MTYKLIKNSKGDRWMKDGKFVSANDVPEAVKNSQLKRCVFCQEPGTHQRLVVGMTVALCDDHYYHTTYGAIAGLLKKEGINNDGIIQQTTPQRSPA